MGQSVKNNASMEQYWSAQAQILNTMPRFQAATVKARKKLNIPPEGMPYAKRAEWYQAFFLNPDIDTAKRYGQTYGYELLPPNKKVLDVLDKIRSEFNLDSRWLHPLFNYISSGGSSLEVPSYQKARVEPRFNDVRLPKNKLRVTSLSIRIEKDTSINDIRDIWDEVEKYKAYMDSDIPSRRDPIQQVTVNRYVKIRDLKAKGLTYQQIVDQNPGLKFDTAKDISDFVQRVEKRFKPQKTGALRAVSPLSWHSRK